ncbi:hypothetical protein [Pseudoalteromonas spongiae]|uniref:Uncharacterized protein n=1 Tax=Pseudoalteromonas spongiae TaxID=298657 RepID=A0ABU8ETF0_9GAMM
MYRIFADHYQFYIYDYDHYSNERLNWVSATAKDFGYISTEKAIYVKTVSDLNDHRIRVFINQEPSISYEQVFSSNIEFESDKLIVSAPANDEENDFVLPVVVN